MARRGIARLYASGRVYRQLLRSRIETGALSASVHTLAGKRYTLERSDSLASPAYTRVKTFDGDGSVKNVRDEDAGPGQRYCRLRIE